MSELEKIQRRVARVRRIATWLDSRYAIPGTKIRFGLDSLVGLIPGAGDVATAAVSLWLIVEAARLGVPMRTIARMFFNLFVDSTVGAVPVAGDVFDMFFKSNNRNAKLLEKAVARRYGEANNPNAPDTPPTKP
ncbi:DUF4112 domain-containing protein [Roseiconus lacunae]|uniref:DUF4112 domain-containing protein n=1 Tax=Roseiconus lacunae TaxID=2605694 RepID=A0ABT7PQE6_9BACT|nr:DUF4112 domain-containing protein [Roseiconus lacunae]MCD0463453.1 DUF4112 domain-containing protein [Roseiconus lacunae]MDM4018729.1 DUF4112 domain-containing protein [Roseiconus lacunae]WRQ48576.1 DUF4112 domain-containing protein [Stieleria sp. HD01]